MRHKALKCGIFFSLAFSCFMLMSCGFGSRAHLDPESQDFYETARLIMTGQEKDIFLHLPELESRQEFIREFWAKRDPDPDTEENEFKEEFFRRIEFSNRRFREGIPGWKTDRGRIYIYLGPPDKIEMRPFINDPSVKGLLWWGYYQYRLGLEFVDRVGDGQYSLNRQAGAAGGLLEVIEMAKFGQIYEDESVVGKIYSDFKLDYDIKAKEIYVSIPVESIEFMAEDRMLKVDIEFEFFIYKKKGSRIDHFKRQKSTAILEEDILEMEEIRFSFPYELEPGEYYFDVILIIKPDIGKIRKFFRIKVK